MDDYLSKPLSAEQLYAALSRSRRPGAAMQEEPSEEPQLPLLDIDDFAERVGGDMDIVSDILNTYLQEAPIALAAIEAAVKAGDATALRMAAHKLKGMSANVSAKALSELAGRMEKAAAQGKLDGIEGALAELREALNKTESSVIKYLKSQGGSA